MGAHVACFDLIKGQFIVALVIVFLCFSLKLSIGICVLGCQYSPISEIHWTDIFVSEITCYFVSLIDVLSFLRRLLFATVLLFIATIMANKNKHYASSGTL